MSCFLDFQRQVAVPSCRFLEGSRGPSDPLLSQHIPSSPGCEQTAFSKQAEAAAAAVLAERHMSPAMLKRAIPQMGHSPVPPPRYASALPADIERFGKQELQRVQAQGQPSQQQHQACQDLQQYQDQQANQQRQQEPYHHQLPKQHGGENRPLCKAVSANDRLYVERHMIDKSATGMQARSQYVQQLVSPLAYGKLPSYLQQMQQLKGTAYVGSSSHESRVHQDSPKASKWGNALFSIKDVTTTTAAPSATSSGDSLPTDGTRSSFLRQSKAPCPQELSHVTTALQGATANPSHPKILSVNTSSSTADGNVTRGKNLALLFTSLDSSGRERLCRAPFAGPSPPNCSSRPQSILTPEAAAVDSLTAAAGIESVASAPGRRNEMVAFREATGTSPREAAREILSTAKLNLREEAFKSTLISPCRSTPAPQQQTQPAHFPVQASAGFPVANNGRVAYSPAQRSKDVALHLSNGRLRSPLPIGIALSKAVAGVGSPQLHATGANMLRVDIQRNTAKHVRSPIQSFSSGLSQATDKTKKAEQQQLPQERHQSNTCTTALQSRDADKFKSSTPIHSLDAGARAVASAAQQVAGFALGRPRTPLRVPLPKTSQHWQPQPQPLTQVQQNVQKFSSVQQQLLLQQQLQQLQGQHPYRWATSGQSVGHGSPVTIHRGVPKRPPVSDQHHREPAVYTCVFSNGLTSACCWQPQSPRGEGARFASPSTFTSVAPMERSRLDCVRSAGGATRIQTKEYPQQFQETASNRLRKRPTSAPPSQNDRSFPPCFAAVPHQQRTAVLSSIQLENRGGTPWQPQSHQIMRQQKQQLEVDSMPNPQIVSVIEAPAHSISNLAFSLIPPASAPSDPGATPVGLPELAVRVFEPLTATGLDSLATGSRPGNCSAEEAERQSGWTQLRQVAQPDTGKEEVSILSHAEMNENPSPSISSESTPPLPSDTPPSAVLASTSPAEILTAPSRKESFSSSLVLRASLDAIVGQKNKIGISVSRSVENKLSGPNLHHTSGLMPCPTSMTVKQKEEARLPSTQSVVPPATTLEKTLEKVGCSAMLQQCPQPLEASPSQDDAGGLIASGKWILDNREGKSYDIQTTRIGKDIGEESARCAGGQQHQDQSKLQRAHRTQLKQPSNRIKCFPQESVDDETPLQRHKQNHVSSEYQQEQQFRTWRMQQDVPHAGAVAPAMNRRPATTNLQQSTASTDGTGREHPGTGQRRQSTSVLSAQHAQRQQRSLSCAEVCFLPFNSLTVEKHTRSSSVPTLAVSGQQNDKLVGRKLQTPSSAIPAYDPHYMAQAATAEESTASVECIDRLSTSNQVSANRNLVKALQRRDEKTINPATAKEGTSEAAEPKLPHRHEQQVRRTLPQNRAPCSSGTTVSASTNRDIYAGITLSTVGSKESGVGGDFQGEASKRSRASSTSSCVYTTSCSRKSKNRSSESTGYSSTGTMSITSDKSKRNNCSLDLHDYPRMSEVMLDENGEETLKNTTTFAVEERRGTGHRCAPSGDVRHLENVHNHTCEVRTHTEGSCNEQKSVNSGADKQTRAIHSSGSSLGETGVHSVEKVEKARFRSITSTDVSGCTGRSTMASNEHIAISDDICFDAYKEIEEDVIPLPTFLWRSPLCLHRNPVDHHSFPSGTAPATADLLDRSECFQNTSSSKQPLHHDEEKLMPRATTGKYDNTDTEQRHSLDDGFLNTATLKMSDFELADPRFGGEASLLGRGTYGVVRLMRHKPTGRLYAVKSIEKSSVVEAGMVSQVEFELLTQKEVLRHRNVLRCYAFMEDVDRVHMVLEYCSGGDLYTRIRTQPQRRVKEEEAFLYFAQLVNGLHYMHTRCIMHRDLKLENLLLDKYGVLKIADLGWCTTILGKRRNFNFCGTLDYLAPEMVRGDGHDWRVDLWGAGILLYEMLDGKPPFQSTRHLELVQQILRAKINMPPHIPPDAGNLIEQLLQYDPENRIPLHAICRHPWVKRMWGQLKKHYYSVYPDAAPAAFDLYMPAFTARQQSGDGIFTARSWRKPMVDLRDVYPLETASTSQQKGDSSTVTKKTGNSPPSPTNEVQATSSEASLSHGTASRDVLQGVKITTSTTAVQECASSAKPYSAATAGTAGHPASSSETPATCEEARSDSVLPAARKTGTSKVEARQSLDIRDRGMRRNPCNSVSDARSTIQQQQRGRTATQVFKRKPRDSSSCRPARKSVDSVVAHTAEESSVRSRWGATKNRRDRANSLEKDEHSVAQPVQERPFHLDRDGCSVATSTAENIQESQAFAGSATGNGSKPSSKTHKTCTASFPAWPAEATGENSARSPAKERWETPPKAVSPFISTAAKAGMPPVATMRALAGLRARTPGKTSTGAAPGRRATATSADIAEALWAETSGASTSRVGDRCPGRTALEGQRSNNSGNCLSSGKARPHATVGRPRVLQQSSKIDSGLGSRKHMLMSPPLKRSALGPREPWDASTPSVNTTEQSDVELRDSLWPSPHRKGQQDSFAYSQQKLQQSSSHAAGQQTQQPTQLRPPVNLPHQHSVPLQEEANQQQLLYRQQQLHPPLNVLLQNDLEEQKDARKCRSPQKQLTPDGKRLYSPLGVQEQRHDQQQSSALQQPLGRSYVGEKGPATSYESPSAHPLQSHLQNQSGSNALNIPHSSTGTGGAHELAPQNHFQHLQHVEEQARIQQRQVFSPTRNRQLQVSSSHSHPSQSTTVAQQSPLSWEAWYRHAQQQQQMRQQRQLLLAQRQVASEQPAFPKVPASQMINQQCQLLGSQQHTFHTIQKSPDGLRHFQQRESTCEQQYNQHQQSNQEQWKSLQYYQKRQWLDQNQQVNPLSLKDTTTQLPYQPGQKPKGANAPQAALHPRQCGQQHYFMGYQQQTLRSMTPPAATTLHTSRNATNSMHTQSYHFLPHQQYVPWQVQPAAHGRPQFVHSSTINVPPFYNASAVEQHAAQNGGKSVQQPCTADINADSQATQGRTRVSLAANDEGTDLKGVETGRSLQPLHIEENTEAESKKENTQVSTANLESFSEETCTRDTKQQSQYTTSGLSGRVTGPSSHLHPADTNLKYPASACRESRSAIRQEKNSSQRADAPCNGVGVYTPRWGRSRQAAADRSETVAPPSLLSPIASTADLRSLLAVSAPPRSCAAAAIGRRPLPRGLAVAPASSEQQRQQRQQVQQMRQQVRLGKVVYAHQQQQRRPQRRGDGPHLASLSRQHVQPSSKEDCIRKRSTDTDNFCGTERLSCFSFSKKYNKSSRSRDTNDSDLSFFCDRLSAGSIHDIGFVSHRVNSPERHSGKPSAIVPSVEARQVLNKLFEDSTPPRIARSSGAKLIARIPVTGARVAATRSAAAAEEATSAAGAGMSDTTVGISTTDAAVETAASSAASDTATAMTAVANGATRAADTSSRTVYRPRQIGSGARFHAQSPTSCRASSAAVAGAAAAWRTRPSDKESRERKSQEESLVRVGKVVGSCTRQVLHDAEDVGHGGRDSSPRKIVDLHYQGGPFDMVTRSRACGEGGAAGRKKTQKLSELSPRKGTSFSPCKSSQSHGPAGRQKQGQGRRTTAKGAHREGGLMSPSRPTATPMTFAGRTDRFVGREAEAPPIKNYGESNSNTSNCTIFRAPRSESATVAGTKNDETSVGPSEVLSTSLSPEENKFLQQQSAPSSITPRGICLQSEEACHEQKIYANIPECQSRLPNFGGESASKPGHNENGLDDIALPHDQKSASAVPLSHEERSQGAPPFQASMQSASAVTPDFPTPLASTCTSTRTVPSPNIVSGQPSNNLSSCAPGQRFALPAAAPLAAQQLANNRPLFPRYWSPPCRVSDTSQWRSCSTSERAFLGRQAIPQLQADFSSSQQGFVVLNGVRGHYPPAATQQRINAPSVAGACGGGALTSSWIARECKVYTTRQQTPPPQAVNQVARGIRQGTPPPWPGMPGGQQHPCHSVKPQAALPIGSTSGDPLVYTFATAAGRRLEPPQCPGALRQQWGTPVVSGISAAAASTAASHAGSVAVHAHSGNGFSLFSFSSQR